MKQDKNPSINEKKTCTTGAFIHKVYKKRKAMCLQKIFFMQVYIFTLLI